MRGGDTDILLGIQYLRYFPKLIYEFETGLGVFESVFEGINGTRGVIGGPHKDFTQSKNTHNTGTHLSKSTYLSVPINDYNSLWKLGNDMPLSCENVNYLMSDVDLPICCKLSEVDLPDKFQKLHCENRTICVGKGGPRRAKLFDEIETAGTEITFRCVDCRSCKKCKSGHMSSL